MSKERPKYLHVQIHYKDPEKETDEYFRITDFNTNEDGIFEVLRDGSVVGYALLEEVGYVEVKADG